MTALETARTAPFVVPQFRIAGLTIEAQFRCSCGTATGWADVGHDAGAAIRRHLAEAHSAAVGYGICAKCGEVTDYFHAVVPELDTDAWACEQCGPKIPTVLDQGAGE
jgi:hypothetical protein